MICRSSNRNVTKPSARKRSSRASRGEVYYVAMCGDGIVTCRHGDRSFAGLTDAGARGAVHGNLSQQLKPISQIRKLCKWLF